MERETRAPEAPPLVFLRIEVKGIVQGVGFRPFVYLAANRNNVKGTVSNNTSGVVIMACGLKEDLDTFTREIKESAPPQAIIEKMVTQECEPFDADVFKIVPSEAKGEKEVLISPDLAVCRECVEELFDPGDRRYRYPFINCTNCGPRFTIIRDTPYDRASTSMAKFKMCEECQAEYDDPTNRRFHAQPNACPRCGPRLWMCNRNGVEIEGDPIEIAANLLKEGKILAIKGLGGFHLACDATSDLAVGKLRNRKKRYGKPLAVMVKDIREANSICMVGGPERETLQSPRAPIVLIEQRKGSKLSRNVAGRLKEQGIFLPYTPLHHLLMREVCLPLVMTSGNVSSEPIAIDNDEALSRLSGIADFFLMHDRDILVRFDDSVVTTFEGEVYPVRRARGYAPYPISLASPSKVEVLALGGELKNTLCLLRGEHAFLSQHIGDMESTDEVEHFNEALATIKRLFSLEPTLVACDLHPDYMTTSMAEEMCLPIVRVQHHHAHVASCMADNRFQGRVIGVAWDGTGYGEDHTVWGGEFLLSDSADFQRVAHLFTYPMPGGEAAIEKPYRMAIGILSRVFESEGRAFDFIRRVRKIDEAEAEAISWQLSSGFNTPMTSSAGRLFDAVSEMLGIRCEAEYEGQAAAELEAVAEDVSDFYETPLISEGEMLVLDTREAFQGIARDIEKSVDATTVAGKFHATMAEFIVKTCVLLSEQTGISDVALSGGVFQNKLLLRKVLEGMREKGLTPMIHRRVPTGDGGISLGQAVIAAQRFEKGRVGTIEGE
ncbi:MAG: carbamoyltransferase HypF [Actinomycetota bacterium]|nr:carbamoyltransferase HypF [Actinomycetota bacterium]